MRTIVLWICALGAVCQAQEGARWHVRSGAAGARIEGPTARSVTGVAPRPVSTAPGDYAVHFGSDAAGKPESLAFTVPDGATVAVAVELAAPVEPIALQAGTVADYRLVASARAEGSHGRIGLVARRTDDDNWYRFVWDRNGANFRLERAMGGAMLVIAAVPAPATDGEEHRLALQVDGFRLRAWFDDVLVLEVLDGAHEVGGHATWAEGVAVAWRSVVVEPPAVTRASGAIVAHDHAATVTVATSASAGHYGVLELSLDRPHPTLLHTAANLELWMLQRAAAPRVLLGDFLGVLGDGAISELSRGGRMVAGVRWPNGAAIAGNAVLVRVLVVTPDGDRIVSRTPALPLSLSR